MSRDLYGYQTRFYRTDPTGRWSPLHEEVPDPWWMAVLGGIALGLLLALGIYWGL